MPHKACTKRSDGTCIPECHMKSLHARSHEWHMKSLHECHVRNVTYRCMSVMEGTVLRRSITEYNPRDQSRTHVRESRQAGQSTGIHAAR